MNSDRKKILCDALPWGSFKYKVFLKERMKSDPREAFLHWANRYSEEEISISFSTKRWLNSEVFYKQDPFFYIKDDSMLTMIRLFLGDNIRVIHEYVTRDTVYKE